MNHGVVRDVREAVVAFGKCGQGHAVHNIFNLADRTEEGVQIGAGFLAVVGAAAGNPLCPVLIPRAEGPSPFPGSTTINHSRDVTAGTGDEGKEHVGFIAVYGQKLDGTERRWWDTEGAPPGGALLTIGHPV
jgi:hypothetical protein